jgi:glycosyltransferase involved in cell wall biosynthesis
LKLAEYLAAGIPVVSTPFGARGYEVEDGVHLDLAPLDDFAGRLERLRRGAVDVADRVDAGRRLVAAKHDWAANADALADRIETQLAAGGSRRRRGAARRSPVVSVVVPCRDAAPWLAACIDSALQQSFEDLELIVVDDGSTDASAEIVERSMTRDPRVRLLFHPGRSHRGVGATLQRGFDAARGSFVALLDADDLFHREKLERQVAALDGHPECVLGHTGVRVLREADAAVCDRVERHFGSFHAPGPVYRLLDDPEALAACRICNSTALIRRDALDGLRLDTPQLFQSEDWLLFLLLACEGPFLYQPEALIDYRVHPGSYTSRVLVSPLGNLYPQIELLLTLQARSTDPVLRERSEKQLDAILRAARGVYAASAP